LPPKKWRLPADSTPKQDSTLHELSIAENLLSIALDALREGTDKDPLPHVCVEEVHLKLGVLAGVEKDALLFCYGIVTEGTPLAGSRLVIQEVAVSIFCATCKAEQELPGIQSFLCPVCSQPSSDVRQGREMELVSIQLSQRAMAE
jgi:hydrogenase nickel incorporation protein HypA/HybF